MGEKINRLLDVLSEFLARRKGLLLMIGILLILVNGVLQFIPGSGWVASTNLLLHLGLIVALVGVMVAWAL
jgi:hypothetical protein